MFRHLTLFGIFLLFICLKVSSQNGFIRTYESISNYSEALIDIVSFNDTIIGVGLAQNDTIPFEFGLAIVQFDTFGNITNVNQHYSTDHKSYFFQPPSKIVKLKNGNYAITGGVLSSPLKIYFLEFDKNCNTIKYFEYIDSNASYLSSSDLVQIDSGFLIFGTVNYLSDKKNDIFIKKIDNNGIDHWTRYYGDFAKDEFFLSAKLIDENTILIGAERNFHTSPPSIDDWYKSWFFKIDTIGQITLSWESSIDEREVGPISLLIDSLNSLIYVSQTSTYISEDAIRIFPILVKRDSSFNLIWKKVIGEGTINAPNIFHEIIPDNNDMGWIMVGETAKFSSLNAGYGEVCSWMYKVNQEGDSIWDRKDTIYWSQQGTFQNNTPGIVQALNGVIYACGYNTQFLPSVNVRATLVKVDRNGCIQSGCNTVKLFEPNSIKAILAYPNPAFEEVNFSTQAPILGSWNLFDASGRNIISGEWKGTSMEISVLDLSTGLYFFKLQGVDGEIYVGKVIVQSM